MTATATTRPIPEALAALPADELQTLYEAIRTQPEAYTDADRHHLAAWYLAVDFLLTQEIIRRRGGDTATSLDLRAFLAATTAQLPPIDQVELGKNLTLMRAIAPSATADLFAALLAPLVAALTPPALPA